MVASLSKNFSDGIASYATASGSFFSSHYTVIIFSATSIYSIYFDILVYQLMAPFDLDQKIGLKFLKIKLKRILLVCLLIFNRPKLYMTMSAPLYGKTKILYNF